MSNIETNPIKPLNNYFYPIIGALVLGGLLTRTVLYCANSTKPRAIITEKLQVIKGARTVFERVKKTIEDNPTFTNYDVLRRVLVTLISKVNSMSPEELDNLSACIRTLAYERTLSYYNVLDEGKKLKQLTVSLCKSIKAKQSGKTPEIPASISPRSMLGIWLALSVAIYFII